MSANSTLKKCVWARYRKTRQHRRGSDRNNRRLPCRRVVMVNNGSRDSETGVPTGASNATGPTRVQRAVTGRTRPKLTGNGADFPTAFRRDRSTGGRTFGIRAHRTTTTIRTMKSGASLTRNG